MKAQLDSLLINLREFSQIDTRRPLLIAHRGGVITSSSPENSLAAIQLAGDRAYDMVELDVVETKDGEPVLFHGWKGHLGRDCGLDAYVHELTSKELTSVCYRESDQYIVSLSTALKLCRELNLGVMLDIKNYGHEYSEKFFAQIADLLETHELCNARLSFSQDPLAYKHLRDVPMLAISEAELNKVANAQRLPLENRWWFGLPEQVTSQLVTVLKKRGALVVIAINRFRYPSHAHKLLANNDVKVLIEMGIDGLQIDSIYEEFVVQNLEEGLS